MSVSYGASLPDSEYLINARSEALVAILPTTAAFIQFRANLERDYAKKLSEAAAKSRLQAIKEGPERVGGGKQSNTLEAGFMKVLEAADLDAREHLALADALQNKVVDALVSGGTRLEGVRKKHHQFAAKLLAERDRAYSERDKSKQRYFDKCADVEAQRLKKSQAKDDRQQEKGEKSYDYAFSEMLVAKDEFIVATDVANVAKARLYNTDLPSLHDDFQMLEISTISHLVHVLLAFTGIQAASLARLAEDNATTEGALRSISAEEDQALYVEAHSAAKLASWDIPKDLEFEECPAWHDNAEMSTSDTSVVYLQNVKSKATARLAEVSPIVESKRREIAGLRNLREAYEKDRSLGDAGSVLENLFDSIRETTLLEIVATEQRAQIELINATLGDDGGPALRLHSFKSSSFVTPATCFVCEGTIWGKGLSCKACGIAAHAKCELKVPPGCGTKMAAGVGRRASRRESKQAQGSSIAPISTSSVKGSGASSLSTPISAPPPMRTPPAPAASLPTPTATVLYEYAATTAFELSVSEAEVVHVVESEDDAGWCKVSTSDGRKGLVPASYLQLGGEAAGGAPPAADASAPVKARVLYDYEAQSPDELSLTEDEYVAITDPNAGEGWALASKDGRVGLVPLSYVEL